MERYSDEDKVERETETDDSGEASDAELKRERAEVVYGDTDMDPNRDDQRSAHHAEPDEHV